MRLLFFWHPFFKCFTKCFLMRNEPGKKSTPQNPSEAESKSTNPGGFQPEPKQESRKPEFKNVETSVTDKSHFEEGYESKKEEDINREEADTEN